MKHAFTSAVGIIDIFAFVVAVPFIAFSIHNRFLPCLTTGLPMLISGISALVFGILVSKKERWIWCWLGLAAEVSVYWMIIDIWSKPIQI